MLSLDHDLDVYASSVGLTKTAIQTIMGDEGTVFVVPFVIHVFE